MPTETTNPIVSSAAPAVEDISSKMTKVNGLSDQAAAARQQLQGEAANIAQTGAATSVNPVGAVVADASLPAGFGKDTTGRIFKLPTTDTTTPSGTSGGATGGTPGGTNGGATDQTGTSDKTNLPNANDYQNATSGLMDERNAAYQDYQNNINQIRTGAFPLTPDQQSSIDAMTQSYNILKQQQGVANQQYTAGVTQAGISAGRNRYAPEVELGNIHEAVAQGVQEIAKINSEMISNITKAKTAFEDQDWKMLDDAYNALNTNIDARQKQIDDMWKMASDQVAQAQAKTAANLEQSKFDYLKEQDLKKPILEADAKLKDYLYQQMGKFPDAGITAEDSVQSAVDKIKSSRTYLDEQAKTAADLARVKAETAASIASASKAYADLNNSDVSAVQSWVTNIKTGAAKLSDVPKNLKDAVSVGLAATGSTQSDILKTTQQSLQELNDMVNQNKGFTAAVGLKGAGQFFGLPYIGAKPMAGSAAADFDAKLNQVKNDVILPNLTLLHGLGRVTDREFQALTSAVTSLSTDTSEEAFKTELQNVTDSINSKVEENNKENVVSSNNFSVVANDGHTYTFSSQKDLDAFKKAAGL